MYLLPEDHENEHAPWISPPWISPVAGLLIGGTCLAPQIELEGSIRLHKAPACALRASLCSPSPTHRGQLDTRVYSAKED